MMYIDFKYFFERPLIVLKVSSLYIYICIYNTGQILKELIWNLHYTDEDQKSKTIVYSYQVMEKLLL